MSAAYETRGDHRRTALLVHRPPRPPLTGLAAKAARFRSRTARLRSSRAAGRRTPA